MERKLLLNQILKFIISLGLVASVIVVTLVVLQIVPYYHNPGTTVKTSEFTRTSSTATVYSNSFTQDTTISLITPTSNPNTTQWRIVNASLTVYYGAACMVYNTFNFSCPTMDTANLSPSLKNAQLLKYQGNYYYTLNFSFSWNLKQERYEIWFTNSTVFCVSPSYESYRTCP